MTLVPLTDRAQAKLQSNALWLARATEARVSDQNGIPLHIPNRMVYLCYISCLRYTIVVGNPRFTNPESGKHFFAEFSFNLVNSEQHPKQRSFIAAKSAVMKVKRQSSHQEGKHEISLLLQVMRGACSRVDCQGGFVFNDMQVGEADHDYMVGRDGHISPVAHRPVS